MRLRWRSTAPRAVMLAELVQALARVNARLISGGAIPQLYQSRARYRRERGREEWRDAAEVARSGYGDCEDLAAYRVGELLAEGEAARAHVYRAAPGLWHVVVRRANGSIEDPSARLGMRGSA